MTWRYSGSEQLDEPDYRDEDELQDEIDRQEEAEEWLREIDDFD